MELKKIVTFVGTSILIGLILSLIFGFIDYISRLAWLGPEGYNDSLSVISGEQIFALILAMSILTGILAAVYYYRFCGGSHLLTGAFSGFVAGIVSGTLMSVLALFDILFADAGFAVGFDALTGFPISVLFMPDGLLILCVLAVISSICAAGYVYLLKSREIGGIGDAQANKEIRTSMLIVIVFILAIALLPQAFAYIGIGVGAIEESHYVYSINVTAARQGNDSIVLTNNGGPHAHLLDKQAPFSIMINGRDATNADTLRASGLQATMSPASGLGSEEGATVTYSGPDMATGGNGTRIVVTGVLTNGRKTTLLFEDV